MKEIICLVFNTVLAFLAVICCLKFARSNKKVYIILPVLLVCGASVLPVFYRETAVKTVVPLMTVAFYVLFALVLMKEKELSEMAVLLEKEKKWRTLAYTDGLTELKNKRAYLETTKEIEETAKKGDIIFAVVTDIDNFKLINDKRGHAAGDKILEGAADIVQEVFCEENYESFRVGGDEFAIISKGITEKELSDKVKLMMEKGKESPLGFNFSVGYSAAVIGEKNTMLNAFVRADKALYKLKAKKKVGR